MEGFLSRSILAILFTCSNLVAQDKNLFQATGIAYFEKANIKDSNQKEKIVKKASQDARALLNQQVIIKIQTESKSSSIWTRSYQSPEYFKETFEESTNSSTGPLRWAGLMEEEPQFNIKGKQGKCMVKIKADPKLTIAGYLDDFIKLNETINIDFTDAQNYIAQRQYDRADNSLDNAYEGMVLRSEVEAVLKVLNGGVPVDSAYVTLTKFERAKLFTKGIPENIEQLTYTIVKDYKELIETSKVSTWRVEPALHRMSEASTELSQFVKASLEDQLLRQTKSKIADGKGFSGSVMAYYDVNTADNTLTFHVVFNFAGESHPKLFKLSTKNFSNNDYFVPKNFIGLAKQLLIFDTNRIPNSITLKARTNKGSNSSIFHEGEEIDIFVTVDKPCFLKVFNFSEFEKPQLLIDTLEIRVEDCNTEKLVFEGSAWGQGTERTFIMASTVPWEKTKTEAANQDKLATIKKLETIDIDQFAGFLTNIRKSAADGMFDYGESYISFSTLKRK